MSGLTSFTEIPNSNFSPRAGGFIEAAEECSSLSMRPWAMWNDRTRDISFWVEIFAESNPGLWAFGTHCRVWTFGWFFFAGRCIFGIKKKLRQGDLAWPTGPSRVRLHRKIPGKQWIFWKTTRLPDYLRIQKWWPLISCWPKSLCPSDSVDMLHRAEMWDVGCAVRQVWVRRWEMLLPRISEAHGAHGFQGTLVWHSGLCSLWWATKDAVPHRRADAALHLGAWCFFLHSLAECSLKILGDPWGNWNQAHHLPSSCWWELLEKGSSQVRGTWLWKWLPPKGQNNVLQRYSRRYSNYPTELTECSILPTHGLGASTFFICLDPLILDLSDRYLSYKNWGHCNQQTARSRQCWCLREGVTVTPWNLGTLEPWNLGTSNSIFRGKVVFCCDEQPALLSAAALVGAPNELSPEAILDRLDESVEFGLPDLDARKAGDSASIGPPKIHWWVSDTVV